MIADQAARLREMVKQRERTLRPAARPTVEVGQPVERDVQVTKRHSRVIAVTSGKGGVGKTTLAVNLGIFWAQMGKRVILLDMDLGLANVDVLLNLRPRYNLSHVIMGKLRIADVLTFCGGMGVVPGSSGVPALANLDRSGRNRLIEDFGQLDAQADIIIVDTAAGMGSGVTEFLAMADEVLVVVTPDPTSVVDAYAMVKTLSRQHGCAQVSLLVNMARDRREGLRVSQGIVQVSRRFLDSDVRALGYIPNDENVAESVRNRQPFILTCPTAQATKAVRGIGRMMLGQTSSRVRPGAGFLGRMLNFLGTREAGDRADAARHEIR